MSKSLGCSLVILAILGFVLYVTGLYQVLYYALMFVVAVALIPFHQTSQDPEHFDQVEAVMLWVEKDPQRDFYGEVLLEFEYEGEIRQIEVRSGGFPHEGKIIQLGVCKYDSFIVKADRINGSDYRCEKMYDARAEADGS